MVLYEVAVDAPLATTLTYSQPVERVDPLPTGCCVRVPLGKRLVVGYILGVVHHQNLDEQPFTVKPIAEVLLESPLFPPALIPLYQWIARYYLYPIGKVLRTAIPLTPGSRSSQRVRAKMRSVISPGPLLLSQLSTAVDHGGDAVVDHLQRNYSITLKPAEKKTLQLFLSIFCEHEQHPIDRLLITRQYPGASPRLRRLCELGILEETDEQVIRDPFSRVMETPLRPVQLTREQKAVLETVLPTLATGNFSPFLLHGVTGCGKTEVYLQTVQHALDLGKTALILVPEIALAAQLESHFYARFGAQLAILHSGLSDGQRFDQWQAVRSGKVSVVLGARSAVFAPLENIGVIIVDEEHEPAYKQEDGLRYNARDLAVLRAKMTGCPVILGSATPSVVSYFHSMQDKYTLLTMTTRVKEQALPLVEIVDLTTTKRSRPDLAFSDELIRAVAETLHQGKQSLLFVNRRGFSPFMLCRDCGFILQCQHCHVSLTLHRKNNRLLCHYCGAGQPVHTICPVCHSPRITGMGIGSERVEEEVKQLFPEARVARLDSDTAVKRNYYLKVLQKIQAREIDILIGTQMIAKGLHFPHITLVGVIWADSGLGMPDYKSAERTFALLAQVTGRAGRGEDRGRVIVQTYQPHHYSIVLAQNQDYQAFFTSETAVRRPLGYPPFSRLVNIRFSGLREKQVEEAARQSASFLRQQHQHGQVEILGPSPSPLPKLKNHIRWQLLLKSPSSPLLHALCEALSSEKKRICPSSVTMSIDVDPENMM
ncbi:primosomal protein N' [Desulfobulbus oligotrophicus]|uniref:Replication restart protein PriA n=1 Tax=Desulfobulbus oligotrophicus TaxID=1909699 RepID=A0A7T5VFM7_9BACT|nr:primosomal protein N' [Desulfobulbus oligotrophicus]